MVYHVFVELRVDLVLRRWHREGVCFPIKGGVRLNNGSVRPVVVKLGRWVGENIYQITTHHSEPQSLE